jgi:protein SCO1/2
MTRFVKSYEVGGRAWGVALCFLIVQLGCGALAAAAFQGQSQTSPGKQERSGDPPSRHQHEHKAGADGDVRSSVIPDLLVLDQQGKKVRFYSDLVKGKTVAINFVYTSCTAVCPLVGANTSKVQELLGDRLGREVLLITITTDPTIDTPETLKAWGDKFKRRKGWTLVTGGEQEVSALVKALTGEVARKGVHLPLVLMGNDARGLWRRDYGLARPAAIAALLEEFAGAR